MFQNHLSGINISSKGIKCSILKNNGELHYDTDCIVFRILPGGSPYFPIFCNFRFRCSPIFSLFSRFVRKCFSSQPRWGAQTWLCALGSLYDIWDDTYGVTLHPTTPPPTILSSMFWRRDIQSNGYADTTMPCLDNLSVCNLPVASDHSVAHHPSIQLQQLRRLRPATRHGFRDGM